MKKTILLFTAFFLVINSFATITVTEPSKLKASELLFPVGKTGKTISLQDLSEISIKDFQLLTGHKMNFIDRLGFKTAQKKVRNMINRDGTINSKKLDKYEKRFSGETGFHIGGFALGFFLGLIGVLIAYLINDDYKHNRVKWSWIGCAIAVVINIILIVAVFNSVE